MTYEIFERKRTRMGTPAMSFSRLGQIAFNVPAAQILKSKQVESVLLLWDAPGKKLAMKSTVKDARAYTIRYNDKGNGASFSAKTFLDFIGIDYAQRRSIPVEFNFNNEYLVEVTIPDACFKKELAQKTDSGT